MGRAVIYYYIFLTYVPQIIFYILNSDLYRERYVVDDLGVLCLTGICLLLIGTMKVRWSNRKLKFPVFNLPVFMQMLVTLAFLLASILFFREYGSNFRHANRVSDAGMLVYLLYVLKPASMYLLYRYILIVSEGGILGFSEKAMVLFVLIGLILSATGSFSILGILLALILATPARKLFGVEMTFKRAIKLIPLMVAVPIAVSFYGLSLKIGVEETKNLFLNESSELVGSLIVRGSSSFASAANRIDYLLTEGADFSPLIGQLKTLVLRLGFIADVGGGGEYLANINRINYEAINRYPDLERAGASPGLVGSFMFLPNFLLGIVGLLLYVKFVAAGINRLGSNDLSRKPLVVFATLMFVMPLFESPLGALTILDPVFVTLVIFVGGLFLRIR